ncbi:MAG: hemolysin (HlyC) family protein [Pseudomonadota bacterium]|nr:hemolysin (HlyC) family protein [Pseudomonadota bacterium]
MKGIRGKYEMNIIKNLISRLLKYQVRNKDELIEVLKQSVTNSVIERDCLPIIEAVLNISNLRAQDIMIPRMSMDVLDINDDVDTLIKKITKTGHSR